MGSQTPKKAPHKGWKLQQEKKKTKHILGMILGCYSLWMPSGVQILNFRAPGNTAMGFVELRPRPFPYSAPKSGNTAVKNPRSIQDSKQPGSAS